MSRPSRRTRAGLSPSSSLALVLPEEGLQPPTSTRPLSKLKYILKFALSKNLFFGLDSLRPRPRWPRVNSRGSSIRVSLLYMSFQKSGFNYHRFIMNRTKSGLYYHHLYYLYAIEGSHCWKSEKLNYFDWAFLLEWSYLLGHKTKK